MSEADYTNDRYIAQPRVLARYLYFIWYGYMTSCQNITYNCITWLIIGDCLIGDTCHSGGHYGVIGLVPCDHRALQARFTNMITLTILSAGVGYPYASYVWKRENNCYYPIDRNQNVNTLRLFVTNGISFDYFIRFRFFRHSSRYVSTYCSGCNEDVCSKMYGCAGDSHILTAYFNGAITWNNSKKSTRSVGKNLSLK